MTGQCNCLSPALAAAQNRLAALRQTHGLQPTASAQEAVAVSLSAAIQQLPPHLGWESAAATAVLRHPVKPALPACPVNLSPEPEADQPESSLTIRLYPSLALGMLREKQVAAGRVWLLLRHLDADGRGWLAIEQVREQLTQKEAPLRVCGWRQLRKLLGKGDGIFWERENGRLWLRSTAKVAATLGVLKLNGRSVALPLTTLTQPIGHVRAHFYASFHSGRSSAAPISRETLTELTSTNRQTQRQYEAHTKIRPQRHFALGQPLTAEGQEEMAWRKGKAAFVFTDHQGQHGVARQKYSAWQLPNSYAGPHQRLAKGRQKQLNRQLADLCNLGSAGNGRCREAAFARRCYAKNGRLAAKATAEENYWSAPGRQGVQFWYYQGKRLGD